MIQTYLTGPHLKMVSEVLQMDMGKASRYMRDKNALVFADDGRTAILIFRQEENNIICFEYGGQTEDVLHILDEIEKHVQQGQIYFTLMKGDLKIVNGLKRREYLPANSPYSLTFSLFIDRRTD